ncbi:MAG TPA: hypothetical protein EYN54_14345 [Methylococcaceae bacterium]|nr:hypothetical protein [Methylococcaceae bacterium]
MKYKQGQTVYMVDTGYMYQPPRPTIIKYFLHSSKQELPPEACIIEKMPVDHLNKMVAQGWLNVTSSRRKAEGELAYIIYSMKGYS